MPLMTLLLACLPTRGAFVREDIDLYCTYVSECEVNTRLGSCDGPSQVYSYDECSEQLNANMQWYDGCDYDPVAAGECLRAFREDWAPGECPSGDFSSSCAGAFNCNSWPYLTCDD